MCTAITRGDPASMGFYRTRMDSRVKHGNDREWRGVMPDLIRHPWGFQDKTGFPCKTCEIDAQISRVKPGDDNREGCR